jgi:hypothetical protein
MPFYLETSIRAHAEDIRQGINAPCPDGLKAVPPFAQSRQYRPYIFPPRAEPQLITLLLRLFERLPNKNIRFLPDSA